MTKNLFITGKPGSGKTTLIREVCLPYPDRIGGFYTEEISGGRTRRGFILKTFDGQQGVLARKGMRSAHKLNKYGIDLGTLEGIGVSALKKALREKEIIVIDEIGSMEILSDLFRQTLLQCLNSPERVLATIRYNAQPFTDEIKKMANTSLLYLSRSNRIAVQRQIEEWLSETGKNG